MINDLRDKITESVLRNSSHSWCPSAAQVPSLLSRPLIPSLPPHSKARLHHHGCINSPTETGFPEVLRYLNGKDGLSLKAGQSGHSAS